MTQRLPTLFIPHGGGPCFFMDPPPQAPHMWDHMADYLRGLSAEVGQRPKALLIISGHWETDRPTLNVAARPGMLFDYYGFVSPGFAGYLGTLGLRDTLGAPKPAWDAWKSLR